MGSGYACFRIFCRQTLIWVMMNMNHPLTPPRTENMWNKETDDRMDRIPLPEGEANRLQPPPAFNPGNSGARSPSAWNFGYRGFDLAEKKP